MNWRDWIKQHLPFTERMRGGAAVWPKGGEGLIGDSLGPIMHIHDGASEIFYFVSGRCRLEIGNSEELFGPGEFVLVPPETPHNLWNGGDEDLLVFWLVAPNFVTNKWRTKDFPVGAMNRRAQRGRVERSGALPSDVNIVSHVVALKAGEKQSGRTAEGQEAVLYIVEGVIEAKVGKLSGMLTAHDFVHIPVETDYAVSAPKGDAMLILFKMPGAVL